MQRFQLWHKSTQYFAPVVEDWGDVFQLYMKVKKSASALGVSSYDREGWRPLEIELLTVA
jgi:hypothetical protein